MFGKSSELNEEQEFLVKLLCGVTSQVEFIFERLDKVTKKDNEKAALRGAFMKMLAMSISTEDAKIRVI